jgi:hypothetical protein
VLRCEPVLDVDRDHAVLRHDVDHAAALPAAVPDDLAAAVDVDEPGAGDPAAP